MDILLIYELKRDLSILKENALKKESKYEETERIRQKIEGIQQQINLLEENSICYGNESGK